MMVGLSKLYDPHELKLVKDRLLAIKLFVDVQVTDHADDPQGDVLTSRLQHLATLLGCKASDLAEYFGSTIGPKERIPTGLAKRIVRKDGFCSKVYSELVTVSRSLVLDDSGMLMERQCIVQRANQRLSSFFDPSKQVTSHVTLIDIVSDPALCLLFSLGRSRYFSLGPRTSKTMTLSSSSSTG